MKRFTLTEKWSDPWFRRLSSQAKLVWLYAQDLCDNVGIVQLDLEFLSGDCRVKITESHIAELGDKIQKIGATEYFLPFFILTQYGKLTPGCRPHDKILESISDKGIYYQEGRYLYPIERVSERVSNTLQDNTGQVQDKTITRATTSTRPTVEDVSAYCQEIGLPATDGVAVFDKWTGSGWKNGGQAIKDWKATIRAWKAQGYMPSQKRINSAYGRSQTTLNGRPPSCL